MKKFFNNIISIPRRAGAFLRSVVVEMKKTDFPTRSRSFKLAGTVLIGAVVVSLMLFAIDALFVLGRTYLTSL